jgi:hypothetical protein
VTDKIGHVLSATNSFDTFAPNNYTFEAEDYDFTQNGISRQFIDNPQTNAYAGLVSADLIDAHNASAGGSAYRANAPGLATEPANDAGDASRPAYSVGPQDYDVGWNNGGNWGNYTRTFPAGVYRIYMRAASPNGNPATTDAASMYVVIGGFGTTNQATSKLGTFTIPNTGDWHKFTWVPLLDSQSRPVQLTNNGTLKTLRITTDNGGYNVNFYQLVPIAPTPVTLTASLQTNATLTLTFPTEPGLYYQIEYKTNLSDPAWIPLNNPIPGTSSPQSLNLSPSLTTSFFQVKVTN